jgi:hypothetical protein
MNPSEALKNRRDELLVLAARYGARNVRVFGSVARGEDVPGSDVDLLVDMEPGRGLYDLIHFEDAAKGLLSREVDVLTEDAISPYLRRRILTESRPI